MKLICWGSTLFLASHLLAEDFPKGDSQIHSQAGQSTITLTTTARMAGAITSLTWDGCEFIDATDHGRELQSACSFDNSATAPAETYNPTEAGSRLDGSGPSSTSRLLELTAAGNHLHSRTQMAFWLAPGERSGGQLARNTSRLSNYLLTKDVRIGLGRWTQALNYQVTFTLPESPRHTSAQFEALTGYLPRYFSRFWQFNPRTRKLQTLTDGPGEIPFPVVLATANGEHAIGIYAPPPPQPDTAGPSYGRWNFRKARVVKWNCVFRVTHPHHLHPGNYSYRLLVPIGTLSEVEAMLQDWTTPAGAAEIQSWLAKSR